MMENENYNQEKIESLVKEKAQSFPYPATPDIAGQVRLHISKSARRPLSRLAWAITGLILVAGLILAVPQARASLVELIRAGAVTLIVDDSEKSTTTPPDTAELSLLEEALFANAQKLTLAQTQEQASFELAGLPDLGKPDAVYFHEVSGLYGQVVVMIWRDEAAPNGVQTLFYQMNAPYYGIKQAARNSIRSTRIDGREAFWIEGAHTFILSGAQEQNLVPRDVLIWTRGDITYRLESELTYQQAVQLAESLESLAE